MDAFILDGDIYCETCAPEGADGPHANGGGEADTPQHCGGCHVFLENPLTDFGRAYAIERVYKMLRTKERAGNPDVIAEWRDFYEIDDRDLDKFEETKK